MYFAEAFFSSFVPFSEVVWYSSIMYIHCVCDDFFDFFEQETTTAWLSTIPVFNGDVPSDPPTAYRKPPSTATATPSLLVLMEATRVHLFSLGSYLKHKKDAILWETAMPLSMKGFKQDYLFPNFENDESDYQTLPRARVNQRQRGLGWFLLGGWKVVCGRYFYAIPSLLFICFCFPT